MTLKINKTGKLALLFASLSYLNAAYANQELSKLKSLVEQKSFTLAFDEAKRLEDEWEGDPQYDYLAGLAAFATGKFDEAVFAFERVMISAPLAPAARLQLAFAYFRTGNTAASKVELTKLKKLPLKPEELAQVDDYLIQISEIEARMARTVMVSTGLTIGYDTNANSGTTETEIPIPSLPIPLTLSDDSRETADSFTQAAFTFYLQNKLTKNSSYYVTTSVTRVLMSELSTLDRTMVNIMGGYQDTIDDWSYSVSLLNQPMTLDDKIFRIATGLMSDVSYKVTDNFNLSFGVSAMYADNKLSDDLDMRMGTASQKLNLLYAGMMHQLDFQYGKDEAIREAGIHSGRDFSGITYRLIAPLAEVHSLNLELSYKTIEYAAVHPVFAEVREDKSYAAQLVYGYDFKNGLSLQFKARQSKNDSNLKIYQYDKTEYWATLNYSY